MKIMNPDEAYQILENVTAIVQLNRADHQKVLQALQVLRPKPEPTLEQPRG